MLDIDIANIIYTAINLLILYFIFKKFLFGRVDKVLEERRKETDRLFAEAEQKSDAAETAKKVYEKELADAGEKSREIVRQAEAKGHAEYDRIVESAHKQADEILHRAGEEAKAERTRVLKEMESEIADLVIDVASRMGADDRTQTTDQALYDRFLQLSAAEDGA